MNTYSDFSYRNNDRIGVFINFPGAGPAKIRAISSLNIAARNEKPLRMQGQVAYL